MATTDRSADIEITWSASANATGYRVYRCDLSDCTNDATWSELTTEPVSGSAFVDSTALAPQAPPAPTNVVATQVLTDRIDVAWAAVTAPATPGYRYRVTTIGAAGESAASTVAEGARAERPVIGYELQIDDGLWTLVPGGLVTGWSDPDAPQAVSSAGTANASIGIYADFVRLSVSNSSSTAGASRSYRVRAVTAYGPAPTSDPATGWRIAGELNYQWERSADASADAFTTLAGATNATYDDTEAPADGSSRWYRVVVSAAGTADVVSSPVAGARQGPPGVPGGVRASRDLTDRVLVEWQAVSGAIGYHVYRNKVRLTSGTGVTTTSYADLDAPAPTSTWAAPTSVTATSNNSSTVTVQWVAPPRPVGVDGSYQVSAVNAAGEGTKSSMAVGNRVGLALVGYDVEVTPSGGNTTWISTGSTTATWVHATAPAGTITPGTVTATQGTHLAHTHLVSVGAATSPGPNVSYRVRGALAGGASFTAVSNAATGRRTVGTLTRQWQRSAGTTATDFASVAGGTTSSYDDTGAPADGSKRWYQLELSAAGTTSMTVGPVDGWRLAFASVAAGRKHTCALTTGGLPWCWGDNGVGQLGLGDTAAHVGPNPITLPSGVTAFSALSAGTEHTCGLTATGEVWCWGGNASGQLGDGTLIPRSMPTRVSPLVPVSKLSCGETHTLVVTVGGEARAWGDNLYKQLGDNTGVSRQSPVVVLASVGAPLTSVLELGGGGYHSCARHPTRVTCWGDGRVDQLGNNDQAGSPLPVQVSGLGAVVELSTGGLHTCARLANGGLRCWGDDSVGQLGSGGVGGSVPVAVVDLGFAQQVVAFGMSTCARIGTSAVYCWGSDSSGQLGNGGANIASNVPVQVSGLVAPTNLGAGAAASHICVVENFTVKCWGQNDSGQLGDGTQTARGSPTAVNLP